MNEDTSRGTPVLVRAHATSANLKSNAAAKTGAELGDRRTQRCCSQPAELRRLVCEASEREEQTGKISALWGRVGELYAAIRYGVKLSRRHAQGHDGRLGKELVEIKTITPRKRKPFVRAKRAGNFSMLAVIRVRPDHQFEARIVRRDRLPKGNDGAYVVLSWSRVCALAEPIG